MAGKSRNPREANFLYKNSVNLFGVGTAFPDSPTTNDRFFRTDLGWLCYWDGTRWLTAHEYWFQIYIPLSATVLTFLTTSQIRTNYAPYITRVAVTTNVATTNSATKYWTVYFIGYDLPQTGITYIDSFTTAADTVNVLTLHEQAPVYTSTPADRNYLAFYCNLTSTPGAITVYPSFYYRLIVT